MLDPAKADGFPKGWVVSDRAALEWSDDNKRVFFGAKPQVPAPDTAARRGTDELAERRRLEHGRRARPVAADDPRRAGSQLHVPPGLRRRGREVRQARRRDDARARRGAGRPLGGRPRHARLHPRLQAPGGRHLSRQHHHRRADADAEEPADQRSTGSHVFGISPDGQHFLYWKDNKFQAYDLDAAHVAHARQRPPAELRRPRVRSPGSEAVLRHRRLHDRQEVRHRPAPLRPVADAARRIGGAQPDERHGQQRRNPLPLRAHRAARAEPGQHRRRRRGGRPGRRRRIRRRPRRRRGGARDHRSLEAGPRSRPTANTRRRPASTSSPTDN